ncbi:MAG TPA: hypothetical protein DEH78_01785 [Solibacterales bacterium]|nr:hypothetical protein [Bryobacterales bacterium]
MSEHSGTNSAGETVRVRANWGDASCGVEMDYGGGEWVRTQFQVADFRHSPSKALEWAILKSE